MRPVLAVCFQDVTDALDTPAPLCQRARIRPVGRLYHPVMTRPTATTTPKQGPRPQLAPPLPLEEGRPAAKVRVKAIRQEHALDEGVVEPASEEVTLAEQVYRALRRDIISGEVPAGQSLRLEYLKERYGISFSPIREALNRLHSERMVVTTSSRGFRVSPFSVEEMWDAIETRILIDCEAMRRSLTRANDAWEARLVGAFHALTLAANRSADQRGAIPAEEEALETRHLEFHHALISACGSAWLGELSGQMYAQTERYRRPGLRGKPRWGSARNVQQEHQNLMDAALARDAPRATELLTQHYRETGRMVEAAYRTQKNKEKE